MTKDTVQSFMLQQGRRNMVILIFIDKQIIVLKYLVVEIGFLSLHALENMNDFACGHTNRK